MKNIMYIVANINNNSLGRTEEVASKEEGKDIIRGWAESCLGRPLTDEEIDGLENNLEVFGEDDHNIWCFSLGIVNLRN